LELDRVEVEDLERRVGLI